MPKIWSDFAENLNWKLVLDVNHCFTNDATFALTRDFYQRLGDRIVQIHLSGFQTLHEPLFLTRQKEIVYNIENSTVPIIIESILAPADLEREREYILKVLGEKS